MNDKKLRVLPEDKTFKYEKLEDRTFNLDDIYIVSLRPGLFHFRIDISGLSFCNLEVDFAYFVEEYAQLDARSEWMPTVNLKPSLKFCYQTS